MDEHDLILDELQAKSLELGLEWDINKALWELETCDTENSAMVLCKLATS
jgi:hypothetical protein